MADGTIFSTHAIQTQDLTSAERAYFQALVSLGILQGGAARREMSPDVEPLTRALHHLLAGGRVKVEVEHEGLREVVQEIETLFHRAVHEIEHANRTTPLVDA